MPQSQQQDCHRTLSTSAPAPSAAAASRRQTYSSSSHARLESGDGECNIMVRQICDVVGRRWWMALPAAAAAKQFTSRVQNSCSV